MDKYQMYVYTGKYNTIPQEYVYDAEYTMDGYTLRILGTKNDILVCASKEDRKIICLYEFKNGDLAEDEFLNMIDSLSACDIEDYTTSATDVEIYYENGIEL